MRDKYNLAMFLAGTVGLFYAIHNMTDRKYEVHDTGIAVIRLNRATGETAILRPGPPPHWEPIAYTAPASR
jgi:hypothetical protein